MARTQLTTITAGSDSDVELGFHAHSVLIDNFSNQYLYIPSIGRYITPGAMGAVTPLNGTQRGQIQFRAPVGFTQNIIDKTQIVQAIWSEADGTPFLGGTLAIPSPQLLPQSSFGQNINLGQSFTPPTSTQALLINIDTNAIQVGGTFTLRIYGSITSDSYLQQITVSAANGDVNDPGTTGWSRVIAVPINLGKDATYGASVTTSNTPGILADVWVTPLYDITASTFVQLLAGGYVIYAGQQKASRSLPVVLASDQAATGSPNTSGLLTNVSVSNVATQLPAANLANRKSVRVTNNTGAIVYLGYALSVTAGSPAAGGAQGVPLISGGVLSFGIGPSISLFGIASAAGPFIIQVEEVS